jgi:hypothetical protein
MFRLTPILQRVRIFLEEACRRKKKEKVFGDRASGTYAI